MSSTSTITEEPSLKEYRPFDYLYDPICSLGCRREHFEAAQKAILTVCKRRFVPIYDRLFCVDARCPSGYVKVDDKYKVPWFNKGCSTTSKTGSSDFEAAGPYQCLFYRRPNISLLQQFIPSRRIDFEKSSIPQLFERKKMRDEPLKKTKTIATQTDYRESETQTDPYTPPYRIIGDSEPEILTLAELSYGKGLPVGQAEIVLIERARVKRAWEASLPPLDRDNLDSRLKMMAKIEWQEWEYREQQILQLQELQFKLLKEKIDEENTEVRQEHKKILNEIWNRKQRTKNNKMKEIRHQHLRELRGCTRRRELMELVKGKPTFVDQILDFTSERYVPLMRSGAIPPQCKEKGPIQSPFFNSLKGLEVLENSLPESALKVKDFLPTPVVIPEKGYVKRNLQQRKRLNDAYQTIQEVKRLTGSAVQAFSSVPLLEKLEKPPPRPVTPEIKGVSVSEDNRELGIIIIQKLMRGRFIQSLMYEGKQRRSDLIQELKTACALYENEQALIEENRNQLEIDQRENQLGQQKKEQLLSIINEYGGEVTSNLLDFLSKELIRLQDERRIHALVLLAERHRRLREAEESGRRQVEERRRREEEEIFRQIMKLNQSTVDVYLENAIHNSVQKTADDEAKQEINALAQKINDISDELEARRTEVESKELVAELVHSFLLPEIQKIDVRDKIRRKQQAALIAAHELIYNKDLKLPTETSEEFLSDDTSERFVLEPPKDDEYSRTDLRVTSSFVPTRHISIGLDPGISAQRPTSQDEFMELSVHERQKKQSTVERFRDYLQIRRKSTAAPPPSDNSQGH